MFKNLSLRARFLLIPVFDIIVILTIVLIFGLNMKEHQKTLKTILDTQIVTMQKSTNALHTLLKANGELHNIIMVAKTFGEEKIYEKSQSIFRLLNNVKSEIDVFDGKVSTSLLKKIYKKFDDYNIIAVEIIEMSTVDPNLALTYFYDANNRYVEIHSLFLQLQEEIKNRSTNFINDNIKNTQYKYNMLITVVAFALIIFIFIVHLLSKFLSRQLKTLINYLNTLRTGDYDSIQDIPYKQNSDEIGDLARAADVFKNTLDNLHKNKKRLKDINNKLENNNETLEKKVKEKIAQLRQKDQLLIQQSRQAAMGEMIGNIAHQWRQPLNALGLVLQNINFEYQMGTLDDAFMERSVDKGKKLTQTMSKTIDDFRNFFKPNKLKEHFRISDVINSTIELVGASYENSNITLVVLNILSNAKDALIENGIENKKVTISAFKKKHNIVIEISDNAGGIPMGVIEKVFDPYFTTKKEGKGTGIGLYMSKTIIETNMGGKLSVENSDDGAVFTIMLQKTEDKSC